MLKEIERSVVEYRRRQRLKRAAWVVVFVQAVLAGGLGGAVLSERYAGERHAGRAVHKYCGATTDADQAAIRERLDAETDPHTLRVNCARESGGEHAEKS